MLCFGMCDFGGGYGCIDSILVSIIRAEHSRMIGFISFDPDSAPSDWCIKLYSDTIAGTEAGTEVAYA